MTDYIIVGAGLAGIAFAEVVRKNGMSVVVFDDNSQPSSRIAGGLYNPVILKRFSKLADAQQQLDAMQDFYSGLDIISEQLNFQMPVLRKFFSIEEQNNWFHAADKPGLSAFLSTNLVSKKYNGIDSPFGYGEVLQTGYVDTAALLRSYHHYLDINNQLRTHPFDYDAIIFNGTHVQYKDLSARHIVFAEGFGLHQNPYFNHLPLDGTKGELFIVKAPELNLDVIVNTNVFILPLGDDLFKIGATYEWDDKTNEVTEAGRQELIERIKEILNCDFQIIEHLAGVRPTVKDRKPLLGTHPKYAQLHILNGLGTRGVMLGPLMAQKLFNSIENGAPIERTYSINRF